jgi:hypothetical protein
MPMPSGAPPPVSGYLRMQVPKEMIQQIIDYLEILQDTTLSKDFHKNITKLISELKIITNVANYNMET